MANIVGELKDQLDRARTSMKNLREQGAQVTQRAVTSGITVGGGALVGFARGKWGEGPDRKVTLLGTEIDAPLAIGLVLQGVALADMAGDYSDELNALGAGMLAVVVAHETEKAVLASAEKSARDKRK